MISSVFLRHVDNTQDRAKTVVVVVLRQVPPVPLWRPLFLVHPSFLRSPCLRHFLRRKGKSDADRLASFLLADKCICIYRNHASSLDF